jgi:hypothetical protein
MNRLVPGTDRLLRSLRGLAAYGRDLPERAYLDVRASHMIAEYRRRRDRYAREASRRGIAYDAATVAHSTANRLASAGIAPRARRRGEPVHTLAFFPNISWHSQLVEPLKRLGPLSYFDYNQHGLRSADLYARAPAAVEQRRTACSAFEDFTREASRKHPIDWVFVYALGIELPGSTLSRIRDIVRAPVVGMCFDDKQSWEDKPFGDEPAGQRALAPLLDLAWTSSRVACDWYAVEGGNPVFLAEGCAPEVYRASDPARQDIDVCFVGARYGFRSAFVNHLQAAGIGVTTGGHGWPSGPLSVDEMIDLMRRAKIILGLGGVGWSPDLKNIKGRDFEAPCIGTYLTSFNPDLAELFRVGEEIACYSTTDEAIEVIRALLRDSPKRRRLAEQGRARCIAEHTWDRRLEYVLQLLGLLH